MNLLSDFWFKILLNIPKLAKFAHLNMWNANSSDSKSVLIDVRYPRKTFLSIPRWHISKLKNFFLLLWSREWWAWRKQHCRRHDKDKLLGFLIELEGDWSQSFIKKTGSKENLAKFDKNHLHISRKSFSPI